MTESDRWRHVEEICHAAGAELVVFERGVLDNNGSAIHEHSTCRMGDDPQRSALDKFNQMHEVKNLLVGLPPTDDEIKAVAADPNALPHLIDTWMALPDVTNTGTRRGTARRVSGASRRMRAKDMKGP